MSPAARSITPADYEAMFLSPPPTRPAAFAGVVGRVVRVKQGELPVRLSLPEGKRLAWCVGPEGLRNMLGKDHFQILLDLGIKRDRIEDNLAKGMAWFLVVFRDEGYHPATWDGLLEVVGERFGPDVRAKLHGRRDELAATPDPIPAEARKRLGDPRIKEDPSHSDHMTPEKYLLTGGSLEDAAVFLWHSLGLNDRFSGDGRCRKEDGEAGDEEFLAPNRLIADIPGRVVIPLQVTPSPPPSEA